MGPINKHNIKLAFAILIILISVEMLYLSVKGEYGKLSMAVFIIYIVWGLFVILTTRKP